MTLNSRDWEEDNIKEEEQDESLPDSSINLTDYSHNQIYREYIAPLGGQLQNSLGNKNGCQDFIKVCEELISECARMEWILSREADDKVEEIEGFQRAQYELSELKDSAREKMEVFEEIQNLPLISEEGHLRV